MSDSGDYGYFGKGLEGYAHYNQAFERNFADNKGGSGDKPPKRNDGCVSVILVIVFIALMGLFAR